ncbi:AAA family ATPase [Salimicrobium flavidum]|nr:AAA family ATPase [Salimicrobium flavidum]
MKANSNYLKGLMNLNKDSKKLLSEFDAYTSPHAKMAEALKELKEEVMADENINILLVVGPSGVGKSKLAEIFIEEILDSMEEEMIKDTSFIPITGIELPNPDLGNFNWKDFYYRVLLSLNEPLVDRKTNVNRGVRNNDRYVNEGRKSTVGDLRRSLERAIYHRRTRAIIIDEAQHFFRLKTGKAVAEQFNSIKSLANMSGAKIILFGTYDLISIMNLDGQLSRRVEEIHFPRYDLNNEKDVEDFINILYTFQRKLPVEKPPDLLSERKYIYEKSLGCVGILKTWLQKSLRETIKNGEETITLESLRKTSMNHTKLLTLFKEIVVGEEIFKESKSDAIELKKMLGVENLEDKPNKRKGNNNPGKRKPNRDEV